MYAYVTTETLKSEVDFGECVAGEIFYWRKHPDLHGWMEKLYRSKGGSAEDFNLVGVVLTLEDLDRLEDDVSNRNLPETEGFFFGASSSDDREDDLEFISKARAAIGDGETVFYSAWW